MPHLPPRSPRRERQNDFSGSPEASDNEDESLPSSAGSRRKPPTSGSLLTPTRARGDYEIDHSVPLSPSAQHHDHDSQDLYSSRSQSSEYDSSVPPTSSPSLSKSSFQGSPAVSTRKTVSGHIPIIPTGFSNGPGDLGPASPTGGAPASPITAIIDQDAEKFRVYMNKLNSSSRKQIPGPTHSGAESQDHAAALGQAVAMENIQTQIEIQQQLMGQTQGSCFVVSLVRPSRCRRHWLNGHQ